MSGLSDTVISASGLNTYSSAINVVSNNLANIATTGFKSGRSLFENLLNSASGVPSLQQTPSGVSIQAVQAQFTQGPLQNTDNPLDFAINGNGFFVVKNAANGAVSYTRDGNFSLDKNGTIVNPQGLFLQGSGGNIIIPADSTGAMPTSIQLSPNGLLNATYASGQVKPGFAQLQLAVFNAPTQLANAGNNLYSQTDGSGAPKLLMPSSGGAGTVQGNTLEGSNVNEANEFVNLISLQNAFQSNATALSASNEMFTDMFTLLGTGG